VIKNSILVNCDRNLIALPNCIKCIFYCGMKNSQINCSKDSSVTKDVKYEKLTDLLKGNIEFGNKE